MNVVIRTIREHIADAGVSFVFPSQVAANRWARKTCTLGIVRSVAENRFLAWDRFKEDAIRKKDTRRKPASALVRKLFAEALIRRNAETAFLTSVIPAEYAKGGRVFVPFIAGLLPSLAYWEKLMNAAGHIRRDTEDEDYGRVKKEYGAFLERHGFFEPSWEEAAIREGGGRYVIFFPELMEDFAEYDAMLKAPRFIRVTAESVVPSTPAGTGFTFFKSARKEIRGVVCALRRLHEEEGMAYEDMAVSVPGLEEMEPCLLAELSLRHIPFVRRAGKKLAETGPGRLFALVNECAASGFSFDSLKALLLNGHIPWKEREKNKALVTFGITYNCVSGYAQNGKTVDIWEEAFKEGYISGGRELRDYYRGLKKHAHAFAGSPDFAAIRKSYFAFRREFLDTENVSREDNDVLSRCVAELGSLIDLEESLGEPSLVPPSPFGFFLSHLGDVEYVRDRQTPGVNIFRWRVAAAAPFACHFVLNASQSAASVLYQPVKFLRQDKRKALGLEDRDASGAFFLLCDTGNDDGFTSHVRISAAAQTFSGWAIAHSFFAREMSRGPLSQGPADSACPAAFLDDPYDAERRFWGNAQKPGTAADQAALTALFPMQKSAYELWKSALSQKQNYFSFSATPVPAGAKNDSAHRIRERLSAAILGNDGCLAVTATKDLNVYYRCTLFWLYSRIFRAGEFSLEAALLDDTSLGLLYHVILQELFARIKDEDGAFHSRRLDAYKAWALEITRAAIKKHPAFKGPLAVPLVSPQAAGMAKKIAGLLELEAEFFDGYAVAELELSVSLTTAGLVLRGVIDRVSVSPDGEPVIIDYKTAYLPSQTAVEDVGKLALREFQMPLYTRLYEESAAVTVRGAFFYNIAGRKIRAAMGERAGGRAAVPSREEYGPFLDAAGTQIAAFAEKVTALDFVPRERLTAECFACVYKTVCRSAYVLNSGFAPPPHVSISA
ncbi:MAG: PD-(D/E)XK nuclease family protein [Treponema sp.]|nr:PD-(D/E)XK nuclease family protein [Treponema sp.]